ncbi:MAG: phosphatase PAP2 family protein [Steroidobacteraceae bacterium]|nr:phosphatase PAP2 family protein [Steroidobacteraceae bacterium]
MSRSAWHKAVVFCAGLLACTLIAPHARAGGGPIGIDHEWALDQSGIWARSDQTTLEFGVVALEAAGSLWYGNGNKLGHTFWQSADASIFAGLGATALKYTFSRARPYQGRGPNAWFQGSCCQSFPSGEVTLQASFVTPFIVNYHKQHPWVWALEALPVYDALARLKSQAHWQTDVLTGYVIGTAFGYWATTRRVPIMVGILPGGLSVGFYKKF